MPDELAISEDFEQYDDADELRRLIRTVKFAQKHFLYFVCCNQVPKQNELIAAVEKEFKGKRIRVVKFKKPITDLLGELQKKKIAADCEAVFVQGLEWSISSDGVGAENTLIYNLNISRDSFKRYLSCPMFLWLPEYVIIEITRHAPDFFSVRSGTFYFSNPPEKVVEQIFQSASSSWNEVSSLPLVEKIKQIETLESLLAEYRGLHSEKQDKQAEAKLIKKLGDFFNTISAYRKAIDYYEQAIEIYREIGDRSGEVRSLGNLGLAYNSLGTYQKAIDYYEQSLAISREIGNRSSEGSNLGNLGLAYFILGDYRKAIDYHEQSLAISREIGNRSGECSSLGNMGNAYDRLGTYSKAIDYYEQSLAISREIGDLLGEGNSLGNLGAAYRRLGDYRKAIDYCEQYLAISREIGDRSGEGISLGNLGNTYRSLGEIEKACGLWKEALVIFEAIESPNANVVRQWIEENC